ncbi:hypothetical protein PYCCODRAFT_1437567 [Trametes coccinea BRFM310]|uniref:Uncharacterized protein n=1 Tax=Trametes coccinea (strain BRFM310) TaxID=1353009 RepID=A0A1Y2IGB0_TRAC3|nr:hypothetical protein PYCCODRAFT_1437567 [Trametes coccinea BRFM310]
MSTVLFLCSVTPTRLSPLMAKRRTYALQRDCDLHAPSTILSAHLQLHTLTHPRTLSDLTDVHIGELATVL